LSAVNAAPVYGLFGLSALGSTTFPAPGAHIHGKQMGYHLRPGIHDLTRFDWDLFMDFFATVSVPSGDAGDAGAIAYDAGSADATHDAGRAPPEAGAEPSDDAATPPVGFGSAGSAGTSNVGNTPVVESGSGCSCRVTNVPGDAPSRFALALLGIVALFGRRFHRGLPPCR
jgi:MYXO-CTERM domain-containing protein